MAFVSAADSVVADVRGVFGFTVDKFPLSGPEGMVTDFYGLFRSDTSECVGKPVKRGYVPHQADDVLALVDAASAVYDGEIAVRCHFREGHHVIVEPTKAHRAAIFGENDNIFPRLIINAGYDGKSFSATMGFYRDLCKNLAIPKLLAGHAVKIRHTSGLQPNMKGLIASFEKVKERWDAVRENAVSLEAKTVVLRDVLAYVYGDQPTENGRGRTMHANRLEAIIRRIERERSLSGRSGTVNLDSTVSGWEAYNAVQGYVQWDAQSKKTHAGEFDRILRASSDSAVVAAERFLMSV